MSREHDPNPSPHRDSSSRVASHTPVFEAPRLIGRYVYLRNVTPDDYPMLLSLETTSELAPRWRYRGATPSAEQWGQVNRSVLAQFIVSGRIGHQPMGLVACYQPNFQDGFAYLAATRFDERARSPAFVLGLALFVEYIFKCWNFRKVYMDLPEFNYEQFSSGLGTLFVTEGRLRAHSFYAGNYWDQLTLALYRETWEQRKELLLMLDDAK